MVIDFQGNDREILVDSNEFVSRNDLKIQVPPLPRSFAWMKMMVSNMSHFFPNSLVSGSMCARV